MPTNPVEDFLKMAGIWDAFKHGLSFGSAEQLAAKLPGKVLPAGERVSHRAGQMVSNAGLATGILGGATMAAQGGERILDALTSGSAHRAEHEAMLKAHPSLREENPEEVEMVLHSIRNLAPSLSSDPLVAGSLVRNILAYGKTEQGLTMPPETARMLADTHSKLMGRGQNAPSLLETFGKGLTPPKGGEGGKSINVMQFDPSVTATQHEFFGPEGNPTGSEHRIYERE